MADSGSNGSFGNGVYAPPVYGDPRDISMQTSGEPAGLTIMSLPPTRPDAYTTQVELSGDVNEAGKYVPLVSQQMAEMHNQNVNGYEIYNRPLDLGGGAKMECSRNFTADKASIHVPTKTKSLGPLHLNFDPSVMTEFAQTIYDKNNGFPLYMSTLDNVSVGASGINFGSMADIADDIYRNMSGSLQHLSNAEMSNGLTYFIPFECYLPFSMTYEGPDIGTVPEPGSGFFHTYLGVLSPLNQLHVNMWNLGTHLLGESVKTYTGIGMPGIGSTIEIPNHSIDSFKRVIAFRVIARDLKKIEYGNYESTHLYECFVDGSKVGESTQEETTWGDTGGKMTTIDVSGYTYGKSFASIKQKMLYSAHLSDSQVIEVTDALAAKWGF